MFSVINKLKKEDAGAMVEHVIILPTIFLIIYAIILTSFLIHDRTVAEAAARRGTVFAAQCISNPNYASLVGVAGELDMAYDFRVEEIDFSHIGDNNDMYRYVFGGDKDKVELLVEQKVKNIIYKTRIPWRPREAVEVTCEQKNYFIYQDVTVTVTSKYSIPSFFAAFGLETEYEYTTTAKISTTDPDEFIRNADLAVDLITQMDVATGGHLQAVKDKLSALSDKILNWIKVK